MTQRDRLSDLIYEILGVGYTEIAEHTADYLLANGVIVPPCKVGDTAYWVTVWDSYATQKDHKGIINRITINTNDIFFHTEYQTLRLSDYRKTWFNNKDEQKKLVRIMQKARKEAEKALKEREKNGQRNIIPRKADG